VLARPIASLMTVRALAALLSSPHARLSPMQAPRKKFIVPRTSSIVPDRQDICNRHAWRLLSFHTLAVHKHWLRLLLAETYAISHKLKVYVNDNLKVCC